jgi:hypothetical protein
MYGASGGVTAGDWTSLTHVHSTQNYTLTTANMPSHTHSDNGHAHQLSDWFLNVVSGTAGSVPTENSAAPGWSASTLTGYANIQPAGSGTAFNIGNTNAVTFDAPAAYVGIICQKN